jgi:phosphotransferase system HPr-like phosphotransfer protein
MQHRKQIRLNADSVLEFVTAAEKCDFDIDVFYNSVVIDAKSIIGVFSMDLTKVLTVRYGEKDSRFEEVLQKYCVA